jgi:hypothetical protein
VLEGSGAGWFVGGGRGISCGDLFEIERDGLSFELHGLEGLRAVGIGVRGGDALGRFFRKFHDVSSNDDVGRLFAGEADVYVVSRARPSGFVSSFGQVLTVEGQRAENRKRFGIRGLIRLCGGDDRRAGANGIRCTWSAWCAGDDRVRRGGHTRNDGVRCAIHAGNNRVRRAGAARNYGIRSSWSAGCSGDKAAFRRRFEL